MTKLMEIIKRNVDVIVYHRQKQPNDTRNDLVVLESELKEAIKGLIPPSDVKIDGWNCCRIELEKRIKELIGE